MMKIKVLIIIGLIIGGIGVKPNLINAWNECSYGSTQARVQKNSNDPWVEMRTIKLGEGFNVGSFHNQSGQFAHDTLLRVDGPEGFFSNYHNGDMVKPTRAGKYVLSVTTVGQNGGGCLGQAVVNVDDRNCVDNPNNNNERSKPFGRNYQRDNNYQNKVGDYNNVYRRNGWWNSDGRARYGEGVYTRDGWWNSDGMAEYGKGVYNRNGWWGE